MNKQYEFTEDWFTHNIPSWEEHLREFKLRPAHFLEIGCFEGRATCWLLDNILTHKASTITCVDTFAGSPEHELMQVNVHNLKNRFFYNVSQTGCREKVFTLTGESAKALKGLRFNHFDCIYIDGSHATADVFIDAALAWTLLKTGGMIIFDDYHWNGGAEFDPLMQCNHPKLAIDAFLACFADQVELIHMGYQVIIRKTERMKPKIARI